MKYEIWVEGSAAMGNLGQARLLGVVEADSFEEACDILFSQPEWRCMAECYDPLRNSVWGCRLFDNETDARRQFG